MLRRCADDVVDCLVAGSDTVDWRFVATSYSLSGLLLLFVFGVIESFDMFESDGDLRSIDLSELAPFNAILNPNRFEAAVDRVVICDDG